MKLSITEGGKEGKSKVIASCSSLEEKFQESTKKEGVGLGLKEKARRNNRDVRFSLARYSGLPKELHENWCEELAEDRFGPCESVGRSNSGHRACRKTEVGSSSGKERVGVVLSLHGDK